MGGYFYYSALEILIVLQRVRIAAQYNVFWSNTLLLHMHGGAAHSNIDMRDSPLYVLLHSVVA